MQTGIFSCFVWPQVSLDQELRAMRRQRAQQAQQQLGATPGLPLGAAHSPALAASGGGGSSSSSGGGITSHALPTPPFAPGSVRAWARSTAEELSSGAGWAYVVDSLRHELGYLRTRLNTLRQAGPPMGLAGSSGSEGAALAAAAAAALEGGSGAELLEGGSSPHHAAVRQQQEELLEAEVAAAKAKLAEAQQAQRAAEAALRSAISSGSSGGSSGEERAAAAGAEPLLGWMKGAGGEAAQGVAAALLAELIESRHVGAAREERRMRGREEREGKGERAI